MPLSRLETYLRDNRVDFSTRLHAPTFTAEETAASAHVPGRELAKPVMVKLDDELAMAVIPATERLHLGRLREASGAQTARLASESEFRDRFPECEVGAMPPFANLFGLRLYVSESLTQDERIAFNAGSHTELMTLAYDDFARLTQPCIADITRH
jgi:Ala-tRNA(Pro) deacylase